MPEVENINPSTQETQSVQLEGGTYEIIRKRLDNHGRELQEKLKKLNTARKDVFGAIETKLIANNRISTKNNCVARDMIAVGKRFIFGYNVHIKLRKQVEIEDVFSVFSFDNKTHTFQEESLELIKDEKFEDHFREMYKYYKDTVFAKFMIIGPNLYMVFQTGKTTDDLRVFKWIINENQLFYQDNRSTHEFKYPPQHAFEWKRAQREFYREGLHPHVSINDRVFVETVGGDLTIKIEDNTTTGKGIYSEPVDKQQTLDDAEFFYADLGNLILLKIRPYQENKYRYIIYNDKLKQAVRVDKIEQACILLPDNQGLIFSDGYYLQSGELKRFDNLLDHLLFEKHIQAPNGEDHLYVFHNDQAGIYVLLPYNLIVQKVENPVVCNGFSLFEEGEMAYFRAEVEASKNHTIQIWQTPYVGPDYISPVSKDNFLFKIGNKDIVRGMAEMTEVLNLIYKEDVYATLYMDLVKKTTALLDAYYWLNHPETFKINEPIAEIRASASSAIDEFEKVVRVKQNTQTQTDTVAQKVEAIIEEIKRTTFKEIDQFVKTLADLRTLRGESISLKELRYVNLSLVESLEKTLAEESEHISQNTVKFLLQETALDFYRKQVKNQDKDIEESKTVAQLDKVEENIAQIGKELELLIDIVSNLKIEDSTQTTQIIDNISGIYASLNQVKANARTKKKDLRRVEAVAEFNAQLKLISQGVINYLDISDTPEKTEEYLTKLMVQLEELEGKFADFEEFIEQLTEKREEVYAAFESKKLSLIEARNKRASGLQNAADRILKGIRNRVAGFKTVNEINAYFASDLMIEKIRDAVKKLRDMGDSVKADEIQSRLKTIREDAVRQLKDRQEMFVEGENVIKFGKHQFSVNVQNLDLTILLREGKMYYHLTGTNFFEEVKDEEFLATKDVWNQEIISENTQVYRAEYLAFKMYQEATHLKKSKSANGSAPKVPVPPIDEISKMTEAQILEHVQQFMATRYQESYMKGVHDQDAAKILLALAKLNQSIDLLRYPTSARACAAYYWQEYLKNNEANKTLIQSQLKGIGLILQVFPTAKDFTAEIKDLQQKIAAFIAETHLFAESIAEMAGEYLFYEITRGDRFIISPEAAKLYEGFLAFIQKSRHSQAYETSLKNLEDVPEERFEMLRNWLDAFVNQVDSQVEFIEEYIDEAASLLFHDSFQRLQIVQAPIKADVEGMLGSHGVIQDKKYHLNYNDFMLKLTDFEQNKVPRFEAYTYLKKKLTDQFRDELRLNEFKPRVLSSFVRNKLINEVYLPLIGDNLAKQIGVVGENKRTDLMGMLLLISPPGYGKTTIMEYIANRLGIIFMKINGPAIGHQVTSLDPIEAPNASAREEINKLNLAFEMGDNVMIYLDDIQHCNPELLQKFISLCDGQRKIEGVYKGKPKTYDLRGKKVCVVMAGNPYTESGEKFQIPDMLANRADTYNLGDIIGGSDEAFKLSYIENCLTSNPVLNKLSSRSQKDIYSMIRLAQTDSREGLEFEGNYSSEEINEYVSVFKKLFIVRDYVLKNNLQYIKSAAMGDEYRTEPPFKLQGSYRDMNKIAEKLVPIMNDEELKVVIMSHYENEAQTLTTGAESNLLKFKELNGLLSEEEAQRWEDIKKTFKKNNQFKSIGAGDQMSQVLLQLSNFSEGLEAIREEINKSMKLSIAKTIVLIFN
ncbi:MAG: DNA repair ATPase [Microscillaceae bacterium]|nr:DNA repair ATPase [Microscillaceae bacterium]